MEATLPDWARPMACSCSEATDREVLVTALRILAEGRPVPTSEVSQELKLPPEEVEAAMGRLPDAEFDPEGRLIAYGLSLRPTKHRFRIGGKTLYTWCAWDAVILPPLLDRNAEVESPCPVSGSTIRITISPSEILKADPDEAVVSLVPPIDSASCCDVRTTFCAHSHFFRSARETESWLEGTRPAFALPIREAFAAGRRLEC